MLENQTASNTQAHTEAHTEAHILLTKQSNWKMAINYNVTSWIATKRVRTSDTEMSVSCVCECYTNSIVSLYFLPPVHFCWLQLNPSDEHVYCVTCAKRNGINMWTNGHVNRSTCLTVDKFQWCMCVWVSPEWSDVPSYLCISFWSHIGFGLAHPCLCYCWVVVDGLFGLACSGRKLENTDTHSLTHARTCTHMPAQPETFLAAFNGKKIVRPTMMHAVTVRFVPPCI